MSNVELTEDDWDVIATSLSMTILGCEKYEALGKKLDPESKMIVEKAILILDKIDRNVLK